MSTKSTAANADTAQGASHTHIFDRMPSKEMLNMLGLPIMLADGDLNVVFVNDAAYEMFEAIEPEIRKDLPRFRAREVVGKNIDLFHKNPMHQRRMIDGMRTPMESGFQIGDRHLAFRAAPFFEDGKLVGSVVEWTDQTDGVNARNDMEKLMVQMRHMAKEHELGDIEVMMNVHEFDGELQDIVKLTNEMVQAHIDVKKAAIEVFQQFGQGNFDADMPPLPGKKAFINDTINVVRQNFRNVTSEITELSDAIVRGDLDVDIDVAKYPGEYRQIVASFERAFASLNSAFGQIASQVTQVQQTVDQMSQSSQSLATNSQIASSSVDEVSASTEQTDAQVKANAESARNATALVNTAAEVAAVGQEKIQGMVQAMEGISNSSKDIAKIIKVIDEIAFQTNLLALNAAVEAARAGQHGRGFAVVAQEVRNLAGRSAKAARETSDLIEGAATRTDTGVRIANETADSFERIASDIQKVKSIVEDINQASDEQSRGVAQINQAIGEVAKTALAASQQADELASTAAQMTAATDHMSQEIGRFKLRAVAPTSGIESFDQMSPEMMAQVRAMMEQMKSGGMKMNGHADGSGSGTSSKGDKDNRGYANF